MSVCLINHNHNHRHKHSRRLLYSPMVCSVKMSLMPSLSASHLTVTAEKEKEKEKAVHQKIVSQYIQKELLHSHHPNFLHQQDMHVFDLNPLTDPLRLVSCNLCKKPVKASQFVFHSELCRSLGIAEELSELDSFAVNRKPPRKERKKLISAGKRVTLTEGQDKFASVDASVSAISSSQLGEQIGISTSCLVDAKGTPGTIGRSAGDMVSLKKRLRSIVADTAQPSEEIQTERGVSNILSIQNSVTYVPAPLATKTYTSQRNNRLQAALSHMYHQSSVKEGCISETGWQENLVVSEVSSIVTEEQMNNQFEKSSGHSSLNTPGANQTFRQGSAGGLTKHGGQTSNSVIQLPIVDEYSSEAPMTTSYHAKPYPFAVNSGLTSIQWPSGSVPAV